MGLGAVCHLTDCHLASSVSAMSNTGPRGQAERVVAVRAELSALERRPAFPGRAPMVRALKRAGEQAGRAGAEVSAAALAVGHEAWMIVQSKPTPYREEHAAFGKLVARVWGRP